MKMRVGIFAAGGKRAQTPWAGFTLIELLVVAAVIGILAGLLLPVLAGGRSKARSLTCLNNQRQLMLSTFLYATDHKDAFPPNLGAAETRRTVERGEFANWVNNVMSWELDEDNTNTAWVLQGGLGLYLGGEASVFKCPADFVVSDLQSEAGWRERVRSISMNAMVGNPGSFAVSGSNTNNPHYRQFFTLAQVPQPDQIFVFIEEHPDSINDGYFLNRAYSKEWHDLPASYHDGGANLAFADGHVEYHRWRFASTKPEARPDAAGLPSLIPPDERLDFKWLWEHTTIKDY